MVYGLWYDFEQIYKNDKRGKIRKDVKACHLS